MITNNTILYKIILSMQPKRISNRRKYTKFGDFLMEARENLREAGTPLSVNDAAQQLGVSKGFVYHVERGVRKPKDGDMVRWASVYGVKYKDLWAQLERIPMDLVATLREDVEDTVPDSLSNLTDFEKTELLRYLKYLRSYQRLFYK